jgi:nucleotide-binding universal stress UspA family protein
MLILLDGSALAEVVLIYARELAGRLNLDLDLLHVCKPEEADVLPMRQAYIEQMAANLRSQSEKIRLEHGRNADKPIAAKGKVTVGYPADEILKYTEENKVDLIMLSTHGRSGIGRWGLGSVADKVIHATEIPVWLVPSEIREEVIYDKVPKHNIVIPLDGYQKAETVIPYVLDLARQRAAETKITLVTVTQPSSPPVSTYPSKNFYLSQQMKEIRGDIDEYLAGVADRIRKEGFESQAVRLVGEPVDEIFKYVSTHPTQLIALSTHSSTGLTRLLFGNLTENIIRRFKKTPIFLVKPPA